MRRIIAVGGGEIKNKTTLEIDGYIADEAKKVKKAERANGLFIGTASHDFMPYYNSFRKTYTSLFDVKVDCALSVFVKTEYEKLKEKFLKADFIYIGGGDTCFMIEHWKNSGMLDLVSDAYNRGVITCGLSAGAICWFKDMYTDSKIKSTDEIYNLFPGLGVLDGLCTPHYNQRVVDFNETFLKSEFETAFAIDDDSAIEFRNERLVGKVKGSKGAYILRKNNGIIEKFNISDIF